MRTLSSYIAESLEITESVDAALAAMTPEELQKLEKSREECKRALAENLASGNNNQDTNPSPVVPCGKVNIKTGKTKHFNIFDKYQIGGVVYVLKNYLGDFKYVLSSGVLAEKNKMWGFIDNQKKRNQYLFGGTLVDILPVVDFAKKYKSGDFYVFK